MPSLAEMSPENCHSFTAIGNGENMSACMTLAVKGNFIIGHWAGPKPDDKPSFVVVGALNLNGEGKSVRVFGVMSLMTPIWLVLIISAAVGWR